MKDDLKQKMIGVIGTHSNALIESIAEKCAQVAIDFYQERDQALSMSGVMESASDAFDRGFTAGYSAGIEVGLNT
jgi:gamma-glutamyl phosphate reductase